MCGRKSSLCPWLCCYFSHSCRSFSINSNVQRHSECVPLNQPFDPFNHHTWYVSRPLLKPMVEFIICPIEEKNYLYRYNVLKNEPLKHWQIIADKFEFDFFPFCMASVLLYKFFSCFVHTETKQKVNCVENCLCSCSVVVIVVIINNKYSKQLPKLTQKTLNSNINFRSKRNYKITN